MVTSMFLLLLLSSSHISKLEHCCLTQTPIRQQYVSKFNPFAEHICPPHKTRTACRLHRHIKHKEIHYGIESSGFLCLFKNLVCSGAGVVSFSVYIKHTNKPCYLVREFVK